MNRLFFVFLLPLFLLADECSEEILFRFFPKSIVLNVLKENKISQDKANAIAEALSKDDLAVVKEIEARAEKMDPNPLTSGGSVEARGKLFKEVITDRFMEVVQAQGMSDTTKAMLMLDQIQETRFQQFEKCQKEGKIPLLK